LTADWSQQTCSPCSLVAEAALTPRDLRILTRAEEELAQCRRFARIFPRRDSAKYLSYLDSPSYADLVLEAWEQEWGDRREEGRQLLAKLCRTNLHLKE